MASQWSEHEARSVLQAWRSSGLSVERYALQHGLVPQRLRYWRQKLAEVEVPEAPAAKDAGLLPVRVVDGQRGTPIQIILPNGHIVRVGRGFDEDTFARVLEVLTGR
jgi:hypothetical protein